VAMEFIPTGEEVAALKVAKGEALHPGVA
jgi:hypothetical protein